MKKNIPFLLVIALALLTLSCKSGKDEYKADKAVMPEYESASDPDLGGFESTAKTTANGVTPKIIKTANLSMEVTNYTQSKSKIDSIVLSHKAYILSEGFQQTESQIWNNLEVRVPSASFDNLLKSLATVAKRVDYQNVNMQDVTEDYIDIKTRLTNKQKVERKYLNMLRETTSIDDILKIENKLGEIRADIESAQGKVNYMDHQVNQSTISLYVYQKLDFRFTPEEMPSFWQRVKESLHAGWKGIVWFIILLVNIWPVWILTAIVYFIWLRGEHVKKMRKLEKKKKKDKKKNSKNEANTSINVSET